jgi:hypothetical protein
MTPRFALVCCGKQKLGVPAPAKDLYQSTLFKKTRAYAERHYAGWFVLSAQHHVLLPEEMVAPYDVKLAPAQVDAWARETVERLGRRLPAGAGVDYFGGAAYAQVARALAAQGYAVAQPLHGLQIGERLRWLTQRCCADEKMPRR